MKAFILAMTVVTIAGCGSARRSETIQGTPPPITTPAQQQGQLVFMKSCNQCHPLGEGGLGLSLNDKPLPEVAVKAKVRGKIPGDMPSFSEQEIPSQELDDLVEYLKAL